MTRAEKEPKRPGMVDWYSPTQLMATGMSAVTSTLLGASIDNRRLIAFAGTREDSVFDYTGEDSFTFDYMADTGDGWDATYSIAYLLTAPSIAPDGGEPLERADMVVIGGDAVYPVASKEEYASRLVWPFNQAPRDIRANSDIKRLPRKDLLIVPGNHDWYDSLGSMSRRFFASMEDGELKHKELGQFNTRQVRSYFVAKLPHDWEIWAVDIQLGKDIDPEQFAFFAEHAKTLTENTRIILCTAEPTILSGRSVEGAKDDLVFALKRIRRLAYNQRADVKVQLAGDTHNYQRYVVAKENKDDVPYERQQFVCGGGGAFLHPTHAFNDGKDEDHPRIEPAARYPDRETSKKLTWGNLAFAFKHPGMSIFLGVVYMLLFWETGLIEVDDYFLRHLGSATLFAVMVLGFTLFGKKKWLGFLHAVAHSALVIGLWWLAEELEWTPIPSLSLAAHIRLFVLIAGTVLAGTLFGLYLIVSLNVFRTHHNEAFSALGSPHYKCFLRCTIEPDGNLTIRSIGVPKTAGQDGVHPVPTTLIERVDIPSGRAADSTV